jgi:RNA polymerase subunit RPABC4/transcription elongation factor Spt4
LPLAAIKTKMIQCHNCGKENSAESNFCRFCGARFFGDAAAPKPEDYNYPAPRPYAWKTDEFQTQAEARPAATPQNLPPPTAQPLAYRGPQSPATGYRCPHCGSGYMPNLERRISTNGWIVFGVLLVIFLPLFWIGLLIKEDVRVCPSCRKRIG